MTAEVFSVTDSPHHRPPPSFGDAGQAAAAPAVGHPTLRALTSNEHTAVRAVAGAVAALGLLGFLNSFARVADAARASFGHLACTVPIGVDLGIAVFSALDIVLARLDMRLRWLRLIPWTLTAATVYLNVAGEPTVFGKVAHAVLPALWVVAVEVAAHVVRVRAGLAAGTRMDRIRASRWFLDPLHTLALWRRMVLWEIRSYPDALSRERGRLLALTGMQDTYGPVRWRWKAPRRTRALYRLGDLAPTAIQNGYRPDNPADGAPDIGVDRPADGPADGVGAGRPAARPVVGAATARTRRHRSKSTRPASRRQDAVALLTADPDMTGAELGRRLKVSERTGRRIHEQVRSQLTAPVSAPEVEGAPA
jgi:hypothetical protein